MVYGFENRKPISDFEYLILKLMYLAKTSPGLDWELLGICLDLTGTCSGLYWDPTGTCLGLDRNPPGTCPGLNQDSPWT